MMREEERGRVWGGEEWWPIIALKRNKGRAAIWHTVAESANLILETTFCVIKIFYARVSNRTGATKKMIINSKRFGKMCQEGRAVDFCFRAPVNLRVKHNTRGWQRLPPTVKPSLPTACLIIKEVMRWMKSKHTLGRNFHLSNNPLTLDKWWEPGQRCSRK